MLEENRKVWRLIREYEHSEEGGGGGRIPLTLHTVLYSQLHEHNLVCFLVVEGCATLFGSVLLTFLLTVGGFF